MTAEIREGSRRLGFSLEALGGERGILAHVDIPGPPRVGRYGVDLEELERLAIPALAEAEGGVAVIDELGKMELASERLRTAVTDLLERPVVTVATVHAHRHPFTDELKRRPDIDLVRVTRKSRDRLPGELFQRLRAPRGEGE